MVRRGLVMTIVVAGLLSPGVAAATQQRRCADPSSVWERRNPHALGMDQRKLQDALDWTLGHTTASVAVYRHGCLAAQGRLDPATSQLPLDGWSMTKSVTGLLVGRAITLGKLQLDAPLRTWFPEADPAHGALTVRHLLTMTSGLHVNWIRELVSPVDRIRDALALPFDFAPGTKWQYQQSTVTLLGELVARATGSPDLEAFAQKELFGTLGIRTADYVWERDRAGHTEGWAHLHLRPHGWARLGQLVLNDGRWRAKQLITRRFMKQMRTRRRSNNAYGLLLWLNRGGSYVLPDVHGPDEGEGQVLPAGPKDLVGFIGAGEQRTFIIPSRDLVIVRLGERGSQEGDVRVSVWTGRAGQLDWELLRRVLRAVDDVPYDDPGPFPGSDLTVPDLGSGIPGDAMDVAQILAGQGLGPDAPRGCTPAGCS